MGFQKSRASIRGCLPNMQPKIILLASIVLSVSLVVHTYLRLPGLEVPPSDADNLPAESARVIVAKLEEDIIISPGESTEIIKSEQLGRPCYISSYGKDGVGHQMEAKLSCIAVAELLDDIVYVHHPMNVSEHGTNPTSLENFFGVQRAIGSLGSAVHYDKDSMSFQPRKPLPWIGKCTQKSWFDVDIRAQACDNASKQNKTIVFTADNCWDYFYCELQRNPEKINAIWHGSVAPSLKKAVSFSGSRSTSTLLQPQQNAMNEMLTIVAHIRRGDSGSGRATLGGNYRTIVEKLSLAWGEKKPIDFIVHTDGLSSSVAREIELQEKGNNNIHVKILGRDSGVSVEQACYDIMTADVFLASTSSLSNVCGLYRDKHPATVIYPFPKTDLIRSSLAGLGWSVLKLKGSSISIYRKFKKDSWGWEIETTQFWGDVIGVMNFHSSTTITAKNKGDNQRRLHPIVNKAQSGTQSILRFDWTSLPPISSLAKNISAVQTRCTPATNARIFQHLDGGLGMNLHTWAQALCSSMDLYDAVILTQKPWGWMDEKSCLHEEYPMLCYFGRGHLPEGRCEADVVSSWAKIGQKTGRDRFEACRAMNGDGKYSVSTYMAAAMEYLFQSVQPLVITEAERQVHQAFPDGLPNPENLITVHMRWGDKKTEVKNLPVQSYIQGVENILKIGQSELNPVHIYLASEDIDAINAFKSKAPKHWHIHLSGPTQEGGDKRMGKFRSGPNGLSSMGALLLAMQSNYYVLATTSNWSRLINELRKNIVDPRCDHCTQMIDLHPGEWPHEHDNGKITFDSFFGKPLVLK